MDDPYWLRRTLGAVITTAIATAGYGSGGCGGGAPGPTISVPLGLAPPSSSAGPELGPEPEQQACDVPAIVLACSLGLCGPNSADLSGFSVDPLSLSGCRNREQIRLIPGTLEGEPGRGCPAERMVLAIEHGKFVGREPSSGAGTACGADALAGATFWISGPAESMPITSTGPLGLDLYSVRTIRLKMKIQTIRNGDPGWYGIVPTGDALVPNGSSWDPTTVDVDMGLCKAGGSEALLVAGEAYSAAGTVIRGEELQQGWFHLACTDSALEHAHDRGYYPGSGATREQREAILKMFMAVYCSADSYTVTGTLIRWDDHTAAGAASGIGQPADATERMEARWTAKGASCLSHGRLWRRGTQVPARLVPKAFGSTPEDPKFAPCKTFGTAAIEATASLEDTYMNCVRAVCKLPLCDKTLPLAADVYFTTYTVDHIRHPPMHPVGPPATGVVPVH